MSQGNVTRNTTIDVTRDDQTNGRRVDALFLPILPLVIAASGQFAIYEKGCFVKMRSAKNQKASARLAFTHTLELASTANAQL